MPTKIKICKKITIASVAALLFTGSAQTTERQNATRDLLERTGITTQMHSLLLMVDESSKTHAARCGSVRTEDNIAGFNAGSVIFDTLSTFNKYHTNSIEPIENWYRSTLAKKIQTAEQEFIEVSSLSSFRLSDNFANPYRKKLVSNIVDNMQIHRFIAIIGTEVEYAGILHSGCISNAESSDKANIKQTLADITREDKSLTALLLRGDIVTETAYLFRNLSNTELAEYEAFTASDVGRKFYSTLVDATQESLKRAGDRLTNSLRTDLHGSIDF